MYNINKTKALSLVGLALVTFLSACKKDGNPNNLPAIDPAQYAGTVDGFKSSDDVYPQNLVAYWSFDDTKAELKTGTAPTTTANDAFINGGVRGKAIGLNAGYLRYTPQLNAFKTDSLKSFTVSMWAQVANNGTKKTMLFTIARPGVFNGSLDFILQTDAFPASNTTFLRINPAFTTVGGGRQDNINDFGAQNISPEFGSNKWTHFILTYDASAGTFNIWGNGLKIGNYPNRGVGNNLFKSYEPGEIIIGGNYNVIPGQAVGTNTSFAAMTGNIDEIRIYNRVLGDAFIKALYNLGKAGK